MNAIRVAVIGSTGFVGRAVTESLHSRGCTVVPVTAPRLSATDSHDVERQLRGPFFNTVVCELADRLAGCEGVVLAAGNPNASARTLADVLGPNSLLPVIAFRAARDAGVRRFVHVSSSVVQGDTRQLNSERMTTPFSKYSMSKALGEQWLLKERAHDIDLIIYRPPSVHAPGRAVTVKISKIARSPLASVSGKGSGPSPQAQLVNVGDAIAFLALTSEQPPEIVHHPWEGMTAAGLMNALGGKEPAHVPYPVTRTLLGAVKRLEKLVPQVAPTRRRVEVLWFGQEVGPSWLGYAGWKPPSDLAAWSAMGSLEARAPGGRG